jgi:hypothetical protein
LEPARAERAAREGAALASARAAYAARPWVLWDRKDALRAVRGQADLDAVIAETPYERVRYEAYLQKLQGLPLGAARLARWTRAANGRFGFVVYAHSRSGAESEQRFLARYSAATVTYPDGTKLTSGERAVFGPGPDFYDVGTFRDTRYTGSLTYRFAAPRGGCEPRGTLRFRDAYGRAYAFPFDLRRYR